jgi:cytochrome c biogenesis protein
VEGDKFANITSDLDEFYPGRLVSSTDLPPFSITLDSYDASYIESGPQEGQPSAFDAHVTYTATPGGPARNFDIQVNHPLSVDGAKVYLIGHGYAPVFKVTDARGQVVYDQATPFVSGSAPNLLSQGVVKVPDAQPEQLGFSGVFVPTAIDVSGTLESIFPAADRPVVSLVAYGGNLGMNSGAAQSVYQLDTAGMHQLTAKPQLLAVGQTMKLPGGKGSLTFVGYKQWASLSITHDPGQIPALVCGIAALAGLLLSFMVRRRRIFVRVRASGDGSVVQVGGLARTDASGGFETEFAELAAELRSAHQSSSSPESGPGEPAPQQETGD